MPPANQPTNQHEHETMARITSDSVPNALHHPESGPQSPRAPAAACRVQPPGRVLRQLLLRVHGRLPGLADEQVHRCPFRPLLPSQRHYICLVLPLPPAPPETVPFCPLQSSRSRRRRSRTRSTGHGPSSPSGAPCSSLAEMPADTALDHLGCAHGCAAVCLPLAQRPCGPPRAFSCPRRAWTKERPPFDARQTALGRHNCAVRCPALDPQSELIRATILECSPYLIHGLWTVRCGAVLLAPQNWPL